MIKRLLNVDSAGDDDDVHDDDVEINIPYLLT